MIGWKDQDCHQPEKHWWGRLHSAECFVSLSLLQSHTESFALGEGMLELMQAGPGAGSEQGVQLFVVSRLWLLMACWEDVGSSSKPLSIHPC